MSMADHTSESSLSSSPQGLLRLTKDFIKNVSAHHTLLAAAGVAYYFALALVPAVVSIVSIYGLIAEPDEVAVQLEPLTNALPQEAANLVVTQLRGVTAIGNGEVGLSLAIGSKEEFLL